LKSILFIGKYIKSHKKKIISISLIAIFFIYGILVGYYNWPPFNLIQSAKSIVSGGKVYESEGSAESQILSSSFRSPMIAGEKIYPPINSIDGIYEANNKIMVAVDSFSVSYKNITIVNAKHITLDKGKTKILQVNYSLNNREYESYAYEELKEVPDSNKAASLIIPGSGINQSSSIYTKDINNYHFGIMDALNIKNGDTYILIKPNEDILAFHNGKLKLSYESITNFQINRGGSYSASYIISSLAMMKYLKSIYKHTIVAGLSQGGSAALLNAIQSEPDYAIISSGYTVLSKKISLAGFDQIVIPNIFDRSSNPDSLYKRISNLKTKFLFTWGVHDVDIYKTESEQHITEAELGKLANVSCVIHPAGHVFPLKEIKSFLQNLNQ